MPLTPEDVQNKEFTTVRLREGYDMMEVDEFLDEIETELARLQRENDELRDKVGAVTRGGGLAASTEPVASMLGQEAPRTPPSAALGAQTAAGASPADAAAKVLALAQKTADELVADSKAEADRLLTEARSRAEKIDAESKAKAAQVEHEARQRAESIESDVQQRRNQVFGKLESDREDLERELETLRAFEREYRSRLKSYLENELRKLDVGGSGDTDLGIGDREGTTTGGDASGQSNSTTSTGSLRSVASLLDDDRH